MSDSARTELKFEPTFAEYMRLQQLVARQMLPSGKERLVRILVMLGMGIVLGTLLSPVMAMLKAGPGGNRAFTAGLVTAIILTIALRWLIMRDCMRRAFETLDPASFSVTYDALGLQSRNGGLVIDAPWRSLNAVYATNDGTYVVFNVLAGTMLPDRAFESQEQRDDFRELVAQFVTIVKV